MDRKNGSWGRTGSRCWPTCRRLRRLTPNAWAVGYAVAGGLDGVAATSATNA